MLFGLGLSHDWHHDANGVELSRRARERGLNVELAHDGLRVPLDLM